MTGDGYYVRKAFGWHGPIASYPEALAWARDNGLGLHSVYTAQAARTIQAGVQVRAERDITERARHRPALRIAR